MKNWLKVLIAVMLVLTCMFTYVACNNNPAGGNNNDAGNNQTPGGDTGNNDVGGDDNTEEEPSDEFEIPEDAWRVKFVYSYTAQIVNDNDRTQNKKESVTVETIYVDQVNDGWTAELLAKKDAITFHGYKFTEWYTEWDSEAKPQAPKGDPYTFTGAIDKDITLYAVKGDKAGDNIVWDVAYNYETDAAIAPDNVDEGSVLVKFVNVKKNGNVTETVALSTMAVDTTAGWTDEVKAKVNEIRYDGYAFTAWSDADGAAYDFTAAPAEDMVLYGTLAETADVNAEATQKSIVSAILKFTGSGAMYDYFEANEIDVPWDSHKGAITDIVLDDGITKIGMNAFANFKAIKNIDFGESLVTIGEQAFYKCTSKSFRTLRLPETVKSIEKNAFAFTELKELVLNDGLESIADYAFNGSKNIKSVVVPASLKLVGTAAFNSGTQGKRSALAKVYYNGDEAGFAGIEVRGDNEDFSMIAAKYYYKEKTDSADVVDGLFWYFYESEGVMYPAQYSYALKYKVASLATPIFIDYVPIVAKMETVNVQAKDENGELLFNDDGTPVYVQAKDENGAPLFNTDGTPVYVTEEVQAYDEETGNPIFEGKVTAENMANRDVLQAGGVLKDEKGNVLCDLGYGFLKFEGATIAEGTEITDDREITCVRAVWGTPSTGILGGGITWSLESNTVTVNPGTAETDTNEMWDIRKTGDAGSIWYKDGVGAVSRVKNIVINEGVKYIGSYVFYGTGIQEVVIPESVEKIHTDAFASTASLFAIYYMGDNIDECEGLADLKTPFGTVYAKVDAPTGEEGAYWMEIDGKKIAWELKAGTLSIGGDDNMIDFAVASDAPWYAAKDKITALKIATNIVSLGENMVSCYQNLVSIQLPINLRDIPESALEGTGIVNNTPAYPYGVLVIDGHLIKVDAARRNVEFFAITTDVANIADGAFSRCDNIKSIFVPSTVLNINPDAFDDSTLTNIYYEGARSNWEKLAKDFNYSLIRMSYSGQYLVTDGVYAPKAGEAFCNHVYGNALGHEPVSTVHATCLQDGYNEYACIFDATHTTKVTIPKDPNAHAWDEGTLSEDGTYVEHKCTNSYVVGEGDEAVTMYCDAKNPVPVESNEEE